MLEDSTTELSDEVLLKAVRAGEEGAYGTLYERYRSTAQAIAYKHTSDPGTVEDIVAEAFARILQALRNGNGPTTFMGGYLSTTIAHLAGEFGLIRGREVPADSESLENLATFDETVLQLKDSDELIKAFTAMPERWQSVLWLTEVEERKPREIATVLDLTPNAVSALAVRARESLREGFLRAHQSAPQTVQCQKYFDYLPALVRESLSERRTQQVREHLEDCTYCTSEYLSLLGINKSMRVWVFPVLAGLVPWTTDGATVLSFISKTAVAGTLGGASAASSSTSASGLDARSHQTASSSESAKIFGISRPSTWISTAGTTPLAIVGGGALALAAVVGGISVGIHNFAEEPVAASSDFENGEKSVNPNVKSSVESSAPGESAETQRTMASSQAPASSSDVTDRSTRSGSLALAGLGDSVAGASSFNPANTSVAETGSDSPESLAQGSGDTSAENFLPLAGGAFSGNLPSSQNRADAGGQEVVSAGGDSSLPSIVVDGVREENDSSPDTQSPSPTPGSNYSEPAASPEENQPEPGVVPASPTPAEDPLNPVPHPADNPVLPSPEPAPVVDPADPNPVPAPVEEPVDPAPADNPVAPVPAPVDNPVDPEPVPDPVDEPVDPAPVDEPVDPAPVDEPVEPVDPAPVPAPVDGEDRAAPDPDNQGITPVDPAPVVDERQVPRYVSNPFAFKQWIASFSQSSFETPDPSTHYFVSYHYVENGQDFIERKWLPKKFVDSRWFYPGLEYIYGYDRVLTARISG